MSARTVIEHALRVYYTDSRDPKRVVERLLAQYDAEMLHETPLFLAEYDGAESEVHLTSDSARAMCDDVAGVDAMSRGWDWSRNEHGDYVQFWTHEDDDRPLHMTGGTVTEIRVQRPEGEQQKDTREGESTAAKRSAQRLAAFLGGARFGRSMGGAA